MLVNALGSSGHLKGVQEPSIAYLEWLLWSGENPRWLSVWSLLSVVIRCQMKTLHVTSNLRIGKTKLTAETPPAPHFPQTQVSHRPTGPSLPWSLLVRAGVPASSMRDEPLRRSPTLLVTRHAVLCRDACRSPPLPALAPPPPRPLPPLPDR